MRKLILIIICIFSLTTASCLPDAKGQWHPERRDYPRTMYKASDLPVIRERINREPYKTLFYHVVGRANSTPAPSSGSYNPSVEYTNSNIAKDAAFVYAVTGDIRYRDKSVAILERLNYDTGLLTPDLFDKGIHISEAIMGYCQAFDMLMGAGINRLDRYRIEYRLERLVDDFFVKWANLTCMYYELVRNNHHTKAVAAIGMAAIVLNRNPMAKRWIDYAMTELETDLDSMVTSDGACAEGPYYWVYGAVQVLPFVWAYHNFTHGRGEKFMKRDCHLIKLEECGEKVFVDDYFKSPRLRAASDWMIKLRQPDGSSPGIDDANHTGYFGAMVTSMYKDGTYSWDWLNAPAEPLFSEHCTDMTADIISSYDDSIRAVPPSYNPSLMLYDGGNAIFRSGWGEDDSYVLFLAEHGQARIAGAGHEHPDGLSFIYYDHNQLLALDSGYIKWEEHGLVNRGKNHNIVLVDGKGPEPDPLGLLAFGKDAFFTSFITTSFLDYALAWTEHDDAMHTRALLFPWKRYLIVADELDSLSRLPHSYQMLLHGNGGGSTGGTYEQQPDGGIWTNKNAKIKAVVTSPEGMPAFRTYDDWHGLEYGQKLTHTVLESTVKGRDIRFLSVLFPAKADLQFPEIIALPGIKDGSAILVDEPDSISVTRLQAAGKRGAFWTMQSPDGYPSVPEFCSDADMAFLETDSISGQLKTIFLEDFSMLISDQKPFIISSSRGSITVNYSPDAVLGKILCKGKCTVCFYTGNTPADVFGESVTDYAQIPGTGITSVTFSGDGWFSIEM
ncbi:MAG TPA: heparinase II/III family protein [Desulfomonilia bacterium]